MVSLIAFVLLVVAVSTALWRVARHEDRKWKGAKLRADDPAAPRSRTWLGQTRG